MSGEQSAFTEIFSRYRRLLQEDAWLRVASCWTVVLPRDHRLITDPEVGALVSGGTPHEVFAPVHPRDTADVTCSPGRAEGTGGGARRRWGRLEGGGHGRRGAVHGGGTDP
jgi:hypothetical protein